MFYFPNELIGRRVVKSIINLVALQPLLLSLMDSPFFI